MKHYLSIVSFLLCLMGCNSDNGEVIPSDSLSIDSTIYFRLDSLNLNYQAIYDESSGIYAIRLDSNITNDIPVDNDIYGFTYELSIPDSVAVENVSDTVFAKVGANTIYPIGIDLALQFTKGGEHWKFFIPASLCYLNYPGDNLIPFETALEFDVNVIEVLSEVEINRREFEYLDLYVKDTLNFLETNRPQRVAVDGFTDFYKLIIQQGDSLLPSIGNSVEFSYEGISIPDSTTFDVGELQITFEGGQVISGIYNALGTMERGETALILLPSSAAYSESARIFPNIVDDGNAYRDIEAFLLNSSFPVIPTYASKVAPYEILTFEITLRAID
ncbi:MAG: FKBP-type peptidyl-prolyl cis-trans isomerase [Cyclobacteriaceae bacterium]|jgi:FKBP-type peptidyl-prolyl cis-trans isomerase